MDQKLEKDDQEKKALLAMVALGFGEVFGSIFNGYLEDKCGIR
jgi:hypothetical protein